MSKISSAIYEIHHMDTMANQDKWLNKIHPLVKFLVTIFYITTVVSFNKYNLTGMIVMTMYPIVLFMAGDISFTDSIRRLRIVLPVVCFIGIFNPFFDRESIYIINGFHFTSGMISMITLMMKGALTVLASYLLIVTTSIEKVCYAMRLLRIPNILVTQILLIYRYVTVLLGEANRIIQAYSLRAPNQKGVHFKVWGTLIGQLLLRSMDRATDIYDSMRLRGYGDELYYAYRVKCKSKDYIYLVIWLTIFGVMRFIPIFEILGEIVI